MSKLIDNKETETKPELYTLLEVVQIKDELLRQLIKVTDALELVGTVTNEGMPLTVEDAKRVINKYR